MKSYHVPDQSQILMDKINWPDVPPITAITPVSCMNAATCPALENGPKRENKR